MGFYYLNETSHVTDLYVLFCYIIIENKIFVFFVEQTLPDHGYVERKPLFENYKISKCSNKTYHNSKTKGNKISYPQRVYFW